MNIAIRTATDDDFNFIKNLVPYYIYDMSEHMGWDPNDKGHYEGCCDLEEYWNNSDHHPYLIAVDDRVAGFAMLRPCSDDLTRTEIGDFFVLRKYRGCGVGKNSALLLFGKHPGKWLVRILDGNTAAQHFWHKIIHDYTNGNVNTTSETYECPHSGAWLMNYYRFETEANHGMQSILVPYATKMNLRNN